MSSKYCYQSIPEEYFELDFVDDEDLGEQIRKQIKTFTTNQTEVTTETKDLGAQLDSLERLVNNTNANKYKRLHTSTATGLTAEQCCQVLSSEFLQYLNDESKNKKKTSEKIN